MKKRRLDGCHLLMPLQIGSPNGKLTKSNLQRESESNNTSKSELKCKEIREFKVVDEYQLHRNL